MVSIEIDGIKSEAPAGTSVIQVADQLGIPIPRFCYHKKLSVAANCRMCLVEVANAPKPVPACATPISEGMKVFTTSAKAKEAQNAVMEFLLINHPLDCPICDQGGECELQDLSVGYGAVHSRFTEGKRVVENKNIGPLVATEMTRCIHCTRCVRFGIEIAGVKELGIKGRGEHVEIATFLETSMDSELSGNVIDLCPVGALTSKPYRFTARAWELHQHPSIAPHDCVGSHVYLQVNRGKILRVVPRECESINETWLSDRDRFSYTGLYHDRLLTPRIKQNGVWVETDWAAAFNFLQGKINELAKENRLSESAGIISPSSTTEEYLLFQKLLHRLGVPNIDYRVHQTDYETDLLPGLNKLGISIRALEELDSVLLVGSNLRKDQPILNLRIQKAVLKGAAVFAINPVEHEFNYKLTQLLAQAGDLATPLMGMAKALLEHAKSNGTGADKLAKIPTNILQRLQTVVPTPEEKSAAFLFDQKQNKAILLGPQALYHANASWVRQLASLIAYLTGASVGELPLSANYPGVEWIQKNNPSVGGSLNAVEALEKKLKTYFLFNIEPEFDSNHSELFLSALKEANLIVSFASTVSSALWEHADLLLPIASFGETPGTFYNVEGVKQSFEAAVLPLGDSKPGWKVLTALAKWLGFTEFQYKDFREVQVACCSLIPSETSVKRTEQFYLDQLRAHSLPVGVNRETDQWINEKNCYAGDAIVRRAKCLQETRDAKSGFLLRMNAKTASKLGFKTGDRVRTKDQALQNAFVVNVEQEVPDQVIFSASSLFQIGVTQSPFQLAALQKESVSV